MPLDLDIPPIIMPSERPKWIARVMEIVLVLGIISLAFGALVPIIMP